VLAGLGDWLGDGADGLATDQQAPIRDLLAGYEIWDSAIHSLTAEPA
jgi:hypothetical protein